MQYKNAIITLRTFINHYNENKLLCITFSKDAELLIYDWSEEGDVEIVVEDVERIKFEYDYQDTRMRDWKFDLEEDWAFTRH